MPLSSIRDYIQEDWDIIGVYPITIEYEWRTYYLANCLSYFLFRRRGTRPYATCSGFAVDYGSRFSKSADELRDWFVSNWRRKTIGRLLLLPDPHEPRREWLVGVNKSSFWFVREGGHDTRTVHSKPLPIEEDDIWHLKPQALAALLAPDWNDENSAIRHALRWHRLSFEDKGWACLCWQKGSRSRLEDLTRWMLHSDLSLWQGTSEVAVSYYFYPNGHAQMHQKHGGITSGPQPMGRERQLTDLFLLENRALPQRPPELPSLVPVEYYSAENKVWATIAAQPPSQHEHLEACLNLRAWLRGKVSQHEIEELIKV